MPDFTTGVVVIGGGSTGAGALRDLAMRGIDATLIEKGDLASGTTGRSHGLLHSGGRYCVNDLAAAIECVEEGRILRRIARTAIEDTGGYFLSVTEEDEAWEPRFVEGCAKAGITCERISLDEGRRRHRCARAERRDPWDDGASRAAPGGPADRMGRGASDARGRGDDARRRHGGTRDARLRGCATPL